ncbi:hypothetical protein WDU94_000558 [Cyamophila willieti]
MMVKDVGQSYFSIIVDESTSIDTKKMMCLMIRYCSTASKKVVTVFYRLVEIDGGDAVTMVTAFKEQLIKDGLNIHKLIGIGVDGANVMVGKHHSFSSILKETVPHLIVVKCVAHSLHLAAEYACKSLPQELDYIIKESYSWFSCSTKRQIDFSLLYETLTDKKPLKLDKLSGTRWLARYQAIEKIIDQWDALKLHFQVNQAKCYNAKLLYSHFNPVNKLYMIFLRTHLRAITSTNKMFQSENVESLKLLQEVNMLFQNYLSLIIPPSRLDKIKHSDYSTFDIRSCVMGASCVNFGFHFVENSVRIDDENLRIVKTKCLSFLVEICSELQKRLPENIKVLEYTSLFTPQKATSQVRPDISSVVRMLSNMFGSEQIDKLLDQWRVLPLLKWNSVDDVDAFWFEVSNYKNAGGEFSFHEIGNLALCFLSLPISNATVERAFSHVSLVKNKLRNQMVTKTVDHIIRVKYFLQHKSCTAFEPTDAMYKRFNSEEVYKTDSGDTALDVLNE